MSLSLGVRAPGALLANQTLAGASGSGSAIVFLPTGSSSATLIANLTVAPGGSVAFTIAEVDPVDQATVVGASASGTLSSKTSTTLTIAMVGICVLVSWTNSGTNTGVDAFIGARSAAGSSTQFPAALGPTTPALSLSVVGAQGTPVVWQVPVTTTPASLIPAWAASTVYQLGQMVSNGGNLYRCRTAGTSAGSGGPTTTSADITDNTVHWRFIQAGTLFKGSFILRNLSTSAASLFYGDANVDKTNGEELPTSQAEPVLALDASTIWVVTASSTATATVVAYQ